MKKSEIIERRNHLLEEIADQESRTDITSTEADKFTEEEREEVRICNKALREIGVAEEEVENLKDLVTAIIGEEDVAENVATAKDLVDSVISNNAFDQLDDDVIQFVKEVKEGLESDKYK